MATAPSSDPREPQTQPDPRSTREVSLQAVLLRLVLLSVVPLVLASAGLIYNLVSAQRQTISDDVQESARSLALSVDSELAAWQVLVETFASTMLSGDFDVEQAYRKAADICAQRPGTRMLLVDRSGQQIFNTARPFGEPLPKLFPLAKAGTAPGAGNNAGTNTTGTTSSGAAMISDETSSGFTEVFASGKGSFSNLFEGFLDGKHGVAFRHPVRQDGQVKYVLALAFHPRVMNRLLVREHASAGDVASIVDRRFVIVSRSQSPQQYVGKSASDQFITLVNGRSSGMYRGTSLEGTPVITGFARSERSGWLVVIGIARGTAEQQLIRSVWIWSTVMLLLVLLGVVMARRTWTQVGQPLRALAANAQAFERGEAINLPSSPVREVRDASRAWSVAIEADRARREQQQLMLAAELSQREAEQASREKDRVLAALGHELRNPLGAITNSAYVLESVAAPDARSQAMIGIIKRQCQHLGRLVDNLLDLARATFGKMQLDRRPLDLLKLIRQTASAYTLRADRLPAIHISGMPVWVDGDATRLDQVIRNLLDNAIKFTPTSGSISVRVRPQGNQAVVQITDTGAGIPADLASSLFTAFVQNEQTLDRAQGGLGLGLALVREIVELHGGQVTAHSEGRELGTQIAIHLPRCPPAHPNEIKPSADSALPPRHQVLVVEDQEDVRVSLQFMLESIGQDVRAGADALAARALLVDWTPDIALIDLGLPDIDGYALARELRGNAALQWTRLVALTGYTQPSDRARADEAGFDDFLAKPVSREVLSDLLVDLSFEPATPREP